MALTDSFPTEDAGGLSIGDTRLIFQGLVAKHSDGSPRLGVLPAHTSALVTGTVGMDYSVAPFHAVTSRTGDGIELVANDAVTSVATTAAPGSNSRIDVIWVRSRFDMYTDAGEYTPEFGVTQGTPALSPVKPSIPSGALELATAVVTSSDVATTTVVITQTYTYTAAEGGTVLVRDAGELAAYTPHDGANAYQIDTGVGYVRSGGAWLSASPGIVLVSRVPFTSAGTVNIDNVFSSRFDNYMIRVNIRSFSAGGVAGLQLRAGGNNASASNYRSISRSNSTGTVAAAGNTAGSAPLHIPNVAALWAEIRMFDPARVARTVALIDSHGYGGADTGENGSITMHHTQSVAYDGFRLITNGPAITGDVSVYGLA